jgi:hypothetical protein
MRMTARCLALIGASLLASCAGLGEPEGPIDRTVSLAPPAFGYQVVTNPILVPPHTEVETCSVVRVEPLGDEVHVWVGEMESATSEGSHHMNVLLGEFSFLDAFLGEDAFEAQVGVPLGTYDCDELGSLMEVGIPVFPSQRTSQRITMPDGVGIPMVAPLVVVMSHRYVNVTDQEILINAALNVHRMDPADVEQAASLVFDGVTPTIEPGVQRVVTGTCVTHRDVEFALVSTHTHEWAECTTLNRYTDGAVEPEPFFVNKWWETPPILHFEADSFPVAAGEGVHFACHYENTTDRTLIQDGTADGEMCVFAAVAYPAVRSVEDITATFASGDLVAIYGLMDDMLTSCDEVVATETPWPFTEEPNPGEPVDTCAGWEQTESNELQ